MRFVINWILAVVLLAPVVQGDEVKNISTGFDEGAGMVIPGGDPDPDYTIEPGGIGATVLPEAFPIPPWFANTATSKWIGFDNPGSNADPVVWDFSTTVSLDGFDASTAEIVGGMWSTDNAGLDILINGVSTGNTTDGNFGALHPFNIAAGLFQAGDNTITFRFENAPPGINPAGLRVDAVVTAVVPEPASIALLAAAGFLGAALRRRRSREG